MELRHLRYVVAIADELHFTRAAEKLGIAQPPLSQQIKQLEKELGTVLFIRSAHGVQLSDAGMAFVNHARMAIKEATRAVEAAKRAAEGLEGVIHLGFTGSASFNPVVTSLISAYREQHPLVEISLTEEPTVFLLEKIYKNVIDVGFMRPTMSERERLVTLALPEEKLLVVLPDKHHLAEREYVHLAELSGEKFILYPRNHGSLLYDNIIYSCRNAGFSPDVIQEAPQLTSTIHLVATGVGIALVPESMRQLRPSGVHYIDILDVPPGRMLWLCQQHPAFVSNVTRQFMYFAEEHILSLI
ncbi:LysR family transcriptional regulator [Salmonella enterica]|nr:LysR family transcriptional regulator [Salmonella enterica]